MKKSRSLKKLLKKHSSTLFLLLVLGVILYLFFGKVEEGMCLCSAGGMKQTFREVDYSKHYPEDMVNMPPQLNGEGVL